MAFAFEQSLRRDILKSLLKPFARFCIRHALHVQDLIVALKIALLEAGEEELKRSGEKVNVSRLSVVTGLHRSDIVKVVAERSDSDEDPVSLLSRVINHWRFDSRFCSRVGEARTLSGQGNDSEFHDLVRSVSKSINPSTVLFELERQGYVERTKRGLRLKYRTQSFRKDLRRGFELIARDIDTLVVAGESNLLVEGAAETLHIRTEFDNLFIDDLPQLQKQVLDLGREFHRQVRELLSQCDQDINPSADGRVAGGKMVVTAFALQPREEADGSVDVAVSRQ